MSPPPFSPPSPLSGNRVGGERARCGSGVAEWRTGNRGSALARVQTEGGQTAEQGLRELDRQQGVAAIDGRVEVLEGLQRIACLLEVLLA